MSWNQFSTLYSEYHGITKGPGLILIGNMELSLLVFIAQMNLSKRVLL